MRFRFTKNDGLAQKGFLISNRSRINTPNIIFTKINKIPIPEEASLIMSDQSKEGEKPCCHITMNIDSEKGKETTLFTVESPLFDPNILSKNNNKDILEFKSMDFKNVYVLSGRIPNSITAKSQSIILFVVSHCLQLYNNPKNFSSYLQKLRSSISPDKLLYMPAIATPQNIAVLLYLGVDFIDTTQAILAARNKSLFFSDGNKSLSSFEIIPCQCPICKHNRYDPKKFKFQDILFHNYFMMIQEMNAVKNAIQQESLREHISIRISNSSHLTSIIRYFEIGAYDFLEQRIPRYKSVILQGTNIDALNRPEVKRFQQYILSRYKKPEHTSILLLLPCSAKKPYSYSKSHKKIINAIQSVPNYHCIHELIITSPLGIVPRELELLYPASSYDIPVTGNWFEDEKRMINNLLKKYLSKNIYKKIIVHLSEPLQTSIINAIPTAISTKIKTSPTSQEDLEKLISILKEEVKEIEKVSSMQRKKDNMFSLTVFQFSHNIATHLLENTVVKGKYPFLKILNIYHKQLGMLTDKRGMISLTMNGAKRLESLHQYYVEISDDFTLKGSVFVPGVIDSDPAIRKGDETLVFQKGVLKGVGVAMMSGYEMIHRRSGKAVDIRHRI